MRTGPASVDVAIVGGGPGGVATALALRRAAPHLSLRVYERMDYAKGPVGAGLRLSACGLAALRAINPAVAASTVAASCGPPRGRIMDARGSIWREIDLGGTDAVVMGWWELQQAMAGHLATGDLVSGVHFSHAKADAAGVDVHFEGGDIPVRAGLLIGADGYASSVARASLGLPGPVAEGDTVSWRARIPYPSCKSQSTPHNVTFIVDEGVIVTYLPISCVGDDCVCWNVGIQAGKMKAMGLAHNAASPEVRKRTCLRVLEGFPKEIVDLVAATEPALIRESALRIRAPEDLPPSRLGDGPVTVVGDALHAMRPTAGHGGSTTLEDAVVLAKCIAEMGLDPEALRAYEAERLPRVRRVVAETRAIGKALWAHGRASLEPGNPMGLYFPFLDYDPPPMALPDLGDLAKAAAGRDAAGNVVPQFNKSFTSSAPSFTG